MRAYCVSRSFAALLVFCFQLNASLAVLIRINPKTVTAGGGEVQISCLPNGINAKAHGIVYMTITRNGYEKPLAFIRQNSRASIASSSANDNYEVQGRISEVISGSHLDLTIKHPKTDDTGTYTCTVYFSEEHGALQIEKSSGNLEVQKVDIDSLVVLVNVLRTKVRDLIDHVQILSNKGTGHEGVDETVVQAVVDEVKDIEQVLRKHNESVKAIQDGILELKNATSNHTQEISTLASKDSLSDLDLRVLELERVVIHQSRVVKECCNKKSINQALQKVKELDTRTREQSAQLDQMCDKDDLATVDDKLTVLRSNVTQQSQQISKLDNKVGHTVAFSAALKGTHKLTVGEILIFSDVIVSKGQGYDPTTGVFTAPLDGIYTFQIVAMVNCFDCHVDIDLVANGDNVIANLAAEPTKIFDQSSVSTVTMLHKGDIVRAKVQTMSDKAELHSNKLSLFSGYLIAAN